MSNATFDNFTENFKDLRVFRRILFFVRKFKWQNFNDSNSDITYI